MTAPPGNFADRPAAGVPAPPASPASPEPPDLLSELLRSVRLSGERIVPYAPEPGFSVGFADMGCLHIVEEGEVTLRIAGEPEVRARRGDFVLLPRGDAHHVEDAAGSDPSTPTRWLCGTFAIADPEASHLLGSLPAVVVLRGGSGSALEGLEVARRMALIEMEAPSQGSAVMIARILDLIFIQILRAWASGADAEPNWLAGAFDPQIGRALGAVHREPGRDWTIEELARLCNLSRSAFAARFVTRVGKPPAAYLAHVRLTAATDLLRDGFLSVTQVAQSVGYTSEAAFSRAFKARYGTAPGQWRRELRSGRPGADTT